MPTEHRVELRAPSAEDRDEFLAAMRASAELHAPWLAPATTVEAFEALLLRARGHEFEPMLVRERGGGPIVGYFNVSNIIRGPLQSAFLGYGAVAGYGGRGYMTEGLELVLERVFSELSLHRLEAGIQPANHPSIALVRRCGFVREGFSERYLMVAGEWRDHERWAIRRELWEARRV
jgi:ribosomal-protein-alanine N-acetyltransferase